MTFEWQNLKAVRPSPLEVKAACLRVLHCRRGFLHIHNISGVFWWCLVKCKESPELRLSQDIYVHERNAAISSNSETRLDMPLLPAATSHWDVGDDAPEPPTYCKIGAGGLNN